MVPNFSQFLNFLLFQTLGVFLAVLSTHMHTAYIQLNWQSTNPYYIIFSRAPWATVVLQQAPTFGKI